MVKGAEKHHPLGFKQHPLEDAGIYTIYVWFVCQNVISKSSTSLRMFNKSMYSRNWSLPRFSQTGSICHIWYILDYFGIISSRKLTWQWKFTIMLIRDTSSDGCLFPCYVRFSGVWLSRSFRDVGHVWKIFQSSTSVNCFLKGVNLPSLGDSLAPLERCSMVERINKITYWLKTTIQSSNHLEDHPS